MPGLSYPFVFECFDCDHRTVVERTDARDVSADTDSHEAIDAVLKKRGWVQSFNGIYCTDCTAET